MNLSEKNISILKGVSLGAGVFTLLIAFTMIFSLIQLKTIQPLDNPVLLSAKEEYDKDPSNRDKAEQVRAMDLMARKAYFSSRWQVETGSYLLVAGAVIFVFCQRLIAGNEKLNPTFSPDKADVAVEKKRNRRYLLISGSCITVLAIISSFVLRTNLPSPLRVVTMTGTVTNRIVPDIGVKADVTNYPFFRGEGSRGIAAGSGFPVAWDGKEEKNIKWKIPVPAPGKSSPVIWGDKLFLTGAEGKDCAVFCIDKNNGTILWKASAADIDGTPGEIPKSDPEAGMAVPTPAVNAFAVCAIFGNGNLICLDLDGKKRWTKNIGIPKNTYGFASSLLIYGNLLIVQFDSDARLTLSGFDLETGEKKWETLRQGRPVWSSPVLGSFDGKPQILINGNPNVSAYDPISGKELWSLNGVTGDVAPSLAVNSTMVYAVTDYAKLIAMKPGKNGSVVWEDNMYTPDVSSPVAADNYLFVSTGTGDVVCYNAEKGDTLWTRIFENPFYASPIICDNKVWLLDRKGIMHVVEANSTFRLVSVSPLGESTDCTPAFSDKKIYIRGKVNLYCISEN
jgi:outer membrane protein assembly factor BamB